MGIPGEWEKLAPMNMGVTAGTETTKISPEWLKRCMDMDKIIVVSEHTRQSIINTVYPAINNLNGEKFDAKVTCPVEVVGYPYKNIKSAKIDLDLKDDFNFLVVGTWIPRKNMENTIKWFVEEFHDAEVGLDRRRLTNRMNQIMASYEDAKCSVYLLHGDFLEEEMTAIYNHPKIKGLLNLSHGEGFGLPIFEAAYNGLPVITIDWGGQCDFLYVSSKDKKGNVKNKPMFTKIPYDLKLIQPEAVWENVLQADSQWAFPKEWAVKKELRKFYKNVTPYVLKAKKLKKWIIEEFSEDKQYEKFVNCVSEEMTFDDEEWWDVVEHD